MLPGEGSPLKPWAWRVNGSVEASAERDAAAGGQGRTQDLNPGWSQSEGHWPL